MIKLTSITKDGSEASDVWLNVDHIIGVDSDDGVTCLSIAGMARLYVAESVERVVELGHGGKDMTWAGMSAGEAMMHRDKRTLQREMVDEYEQFLRERRREYVDDIGRWESDGGN